MINVIEDNLYEEFTIDLLSKEIGYSKYHMCKIFRNTTGYSINQYKLKRRLSEATKMILYTNRSLLDIAISCGYPNDKYFSKIFKDKFGINPSVYRKSNKFLVLTKKIVLKEEYKMKYSNLDKFINDILKCSTTNDLISFIASTDNCVITKQKNCDVELIIVLHDDNQKGKVLVQVNIDLINGRYVEQHIYNVGNAEDVEIVDLNIIGDVPTFYFYNSSNKKKSKVSLEVYKEHRIELGSTWKGYDN